jgi:hypothetical protein
VVSLLAALFLPLIAPRGNNDHHHVAILLSGIQLIFIGMLGVYVTSIHAQVRHGPMVVERETINILRRRLRRISVLRRRPQKWAAKFIVGFHFAVNLSALAVAYFPGMGFVSQSVVERLVVSEMVRLLPSINRYARFAILRLSTNWSQISLPTMVRRSSAFNGSGTHRAKAAITELR